MKSIGVIISGIGFEEGTNIWDISYILREADRNNLYPIALVPIQSVEETMPAPRRRKATKRNFLEETKQIIRGEIKFIGEISPKDIDFVVIPGGKGAISVLSSIAEDGTDAVVLPDMRDLLAGMWVRGKPTSAMGHGILLLAFVLRHKAQPVVAIPDYPGAVDILRKIGADTIQAKPDEVIFDNENNIITTPGTSPCSSSLYKASLGIEKMIEELASMKPIRRAWQ